PAAPAVAPEKPSPAGLRKHVAKPRRASASAEAIGPADTAAPTVSEPAPPAPPVEQKPAAAPAPPTAPPSPVAEAPAAQPPAPAPAPSPVRATIPAGTPIVIRTEGALSTKRNLQGDTFTATLVEPVVAGGYVIAEAGAAVEGTVTRAERAGRVEGVSALAVELVRLHTSDGQRVSISTDQHEVDGQRTRRADAEKIGAAAVIGAVIGAVAGGGKGAAAGAGAGAGAGTGAVLATRGKDAVIPGESILTFHIRAPIEVTERR
ncbi:MAG TPA: hypothetical protein VEU62_10575, partial [Bryobacterales bacterium]|nr:hypothetical protein [Bryobacterales bacterium]